MGNTVLMYIKHKSNQIYPVKNICLLPKIDDYEQFYLKYYEKMKFELSEATVQDVPGLNVRFGPFKIFIASIQRKMLLKVYFVRLDNHRLEK